MPNVHNAWHDPNKENPFHPKCLSRYCARCSSCFLPLLWLWVIYSFLLISAFLLFAICWSPFDCLDGAFISVFLNFGPRTIPIRVSSGNLLEIQFHGPKLWPTKSVSNPQVMCMQSCFTYSSISLGHKMPKYKAFLIKLNILKSLIKFKVITQPGIWVLCINYFTKPHKNLIKEVSYSHFTG